MLHFMPKQNVFPPMGNNSFGGSGRHCVHLRYRKDDNIVVNELLI